MDVINKIEFLSWNFVLIVKRIFLGSSKGQIGAIVILLHYDLVFSVNSSRNELPAYINPA